MNINCPCCAKPLSPIGKLVKETLFGLKLIDQDISKKCYNCGTAFSVKTVVKNNEYVQALYYDIKVPNSVIRSIGIIKNLQK